MLLSGRADLIAERLDLRLWSGSGSLAEPTTAVELMVSEGKTMARQGGGPWRELNGVTDTLAPQGDMLAYLAAVRDVQLLGDEERAGRSFTRYAFTLDGPRLAGYLRDQLEHQLQATGELPPGVRLEAADSYARAEGSGELWVAADGLPLRQILNLRFPEHGGERVGARIVIDFSDFTAPRDLPLISADLASGTLALTLGLACMAALITFAHSRRVHVALASLLICALVGGPLLTSLRVRGFFDAQAAQAAERANQAEESEMARTLRSLTTNQHFDPHADPQAAAQPTALVFAAPQAIANPNSDDDGDTLTNAVEAYIGTSSSTADADDNGVPDGRDSDGDLVDDNLEVTGFTLGGQTWRGDPLQRDSNSDGIGDTQEWLGDANSDNLPDDTDSDGLPDLFDNDNDNDGVPDRLDLSPQRLARPGDANSFFNAQTPLQISLNNLTTDTLALLDLQLRPADVEQLWFSQSVLDWPSDRRGQYQDADRATFADLALQEGRTPDASEYNGDMKLVPMLEVRIASGAGIPDQNRLTTYNVSVQENSDGSRLLYAPLSIVSDQDTGARVAFNARMPFTAGVQTQEIRLVWAVQMLVDICAQSVDGECVEYASSNTAQVIQTYAEPWMLTGTILREDHGTTLATIYEDPSATNETDLREDGTLWLLAHGLDSSFLGGRTTGDQRDLDLAEITRRFDRQSNSGVSDEQRWGLENLLRVQTQSYASYDEAVMSTAMTTTKELLDASFSPFWSATDANPIKPLLLFAREELFRSQSLDSAGDGYVSHNDATIRFDLAPTGLPAAPLLLQAGMSWSAYCAEQGAGGTADWATCASDDYWEELERRYDGKMAQTGDTADMTAGRMTLAQVYFLSLSQGTGRIVTSNGVIQAPSYTPLADRDTLSLVRSVRNGSAAVVSGLLNLTIMARYTDKISTLEYLGRLLTETRKGALGQGIAGIGRSLIDKLGYKAGMTVVGVAVVAVVAALAVGTYFLMKYYFAGEIGGKIALSSLLIGITALLSIVLPIITVVEWVNAFRAAGVGTLSALRAVLGASSALVGTSQMAGVIGAIVATLVVWGFFIYAMVTSKTTPFSAEFNRAFAEAIAATIYVIILAVLSATVIGLLLVGLIAVIDGILTAVCELGVEDLRNVPGLDGACFTLGTAATKGIAKLLYSFDVMVDVERDDLIVTGAPDISLADQNLGFVTGNLLSLQLPVTTTVTHKSPKPEDWMHIVPYLWMYSEDNLRTSTFQYTLTRDPAALNVSRSEMDDAWTVERDRVFGAEIGGVDVGQTMYRGQAISNHAPLSGIDLAPGLNRQINFNLNIGYAVPAYECWTIPNVIPPFTPPAIPVCYTRTVDGNRSAPLTDRIQLDILPNTLTGFRDLATDGNGGFKLSWDAAFTSLQDADGDGLRAQSQGGLDPDDSTWDADGDGLSDALELDRRQAGLSISPVSWDTDGDTLTDAQELAFGTHPVRADTDNDGLSDAEERYHQVYTFDSTLRRVVPTTTWTGGWEISVPGLSFPLPVSADPTQADPDGDSITDEAERQLARATNAADRLDRDGAPYHPRVLNANPVQITTTMNDANLVVRPGQSLVYTTTVVGESSLLAGGGLAVSSSAAAFPDLLRTFALDFSSTTANVSAVTVNVAAQAASGEAVIDSLVKARLQGSGEPTLSWADPQLGTLGSFTNKTLRRSFAAPTGQGRQDSYVVVGQAAGSTDYRPSFDSQDSLWDELRKGDLPVFALPSGQNVAVDNDRQDSETLLGSTGPKVACDEAGNCMVVWSRYQNCGSAVVQSLRITGNSDESNGADIAIYLRRDSNFLRANQPQIERIGYWQNIATSSSIQINRTIEESCGTGELLIYEYDDDTALTIDTLPTSSVYQIGDVQLIPTTQTAQDWTFGGAAQSGSVNGSVNVDFADQVMRPVSGALVGADGSLQLERTNLSSLSGTSAEEWGPVVASNGTNFLVAWERTNTVAQTGDDLVESRIVVRRFSSTGTPQTDELVLPVEQSVSVARYSPRPRLQLDIAWVGDAYRVIWGLNNGTVRMADFNQNGSLIANSTRTLATNAWSPQIAYNPVSKRMLVVYESTNSHVVAWLFTSRSDSGSQSRLATNGIAPRVTYHSVAQAWLVGWTDLSGNLNNQKYTLINSDGTTRSDLTPPSVRWSAQPAFVSGGNLACPAVGDEPIMSLMFEEYPGATSFADSSAFGGSGSCTDGHCPIAGATGADTLVSPRSDFAVAFNGTNQSLTATAGTNASLTSSLSLAFWFRTSQTSGATNVEWNQGFGLVTGNNLGFSLSGGQLHFGTSTGGTLRSSSVADNAWHLAVATVGRGQAKLYIDGVEVASRNGASVSSSALNLVLGRQAAGGSFYNGSLDQLQVFPTVLSPAAVTALYERTTQSYCMATSPQSSTIETAKLTLNRNDTRGGLINPSRSLTLLVDGDAPSSTITSPASGATLAAPSGAVTLIIGGSASDPTSEVALVEVSVNGGSFETAEGGASWTYAAVLTPGNNTIVTRATDAAGNAETPGAAVTVLVDDLAPTASFDQILTSGPVAAARRTDGRWSLLLRGSITDPQSGGVAGSGIDSESLSVALQSVDADAGDPQGASRQAATLSGERWQLNYTLPADISDPSGVYTATLHAADQAGNQTEVTVQLTVDGVGPVLSLHDDLREVTVITSTQTISGTSQDTTTAAVDGRFLPVEQAATLANAVLWLPLDEAVGSVYFTDRTAARTDMACQPSTCPTAGEAGRVDQAVRFTAESGLRSTSTFSLAADQSLTLAVWVKADGSDGDLLKGSGDDDGVSARRFGLLLDAGRPVLEVGSQRYAADAALASGWRHVAAVIDRENGQATLYVDGTAVVSGQLPAAEPLGGGFLRLGGGYSGLIDEATLITAVLNTAQLQAIYTLADTPWRSATLNATGSNWSLAVPNGLEGQYQLDLRAEDALGNRSFVGNSWRIVIDTRAPRLTLAAQPTGSSYVDEQGTTYNEVVYTYSARDRHLDDEQLAGPCDAIPERSFADLTNLGGLFGDLTVRDGLSVRCTQWEASNTAAPTLTACDIYDHCASATFSSSQASTQATLATAVASGPRAVVTSPTDGAVVAVGADGQIEVVVAAEASAGLAQVTLALDGVNVASIDLSTGTARTRAVRSVKISVSEGSHTLSTSATDRSGATQSEGFSVSFQADTALPSVTIDKLTLNGDDRLSAGSGMLRLSGSASDSLGLAVVQLQIGDGAFGDVTLQADGQWSTTRWFGWGIEGNSYSVTLRATDRAGRVTDITRTVQVDLAPLPAVETELSGGPSTTTRERTAAFSFTGTAATDRTVVEFRCRLNDASFASCVSPMSYSDLAPGDYTFQVYAVDDLGNTDSTPASYSWSVQGSRTVYLPLIAK
jgi:hypothetical protein